MNYPVPASVVIVTKNEEKRIGKCLVALEPYFDDIWVVDSRSGDATVPIARSYGAKVVDYVWRGQYPKKRGWCLEALDLKYDWVLFIDADEVMSEALARALADLDLSSESPYAGYFVRGRYIWQGRVLRHGLSNNKLALLHRKKMHFPVVDDLDIPGMGELEGHYQPVLKDGYGDLKIGQVHAPLLHDAGKSWEARHRRYALWEAGMNARNSWPRDPSVLREGMKRCFRAMPFRGVAAFAHCYIFKRGFLDGAAGLDFARCRARYYGMISDASKERARLGESAR